MAHILVIFSFSGGYPVPQLTSEERTVCKVDITGSLLASLIVKLSRTFHTPQGTQLPPDKQAGMYFCLHTCVYMCTNFILAHFSVFLSLGKPWEVKQRMCIHGEKCQVLAQGV